MAMSNELGGAGYIKSVGPSLTFGLGHMWIRESGSGFLEHISKHFEQVSH